MALKQEITSCTTYRICFVPTDHRQPMENGPQPVGQGHPSRGTKVIGGCRAHFQDQAGRSDVVSGEDWTSSVMHGSGVSIQG